jgi:predicted transcriptional regulator
MSLSDSIASSGEMIPRFFMYTHPHLKETALLYRALGNERRLRILELLHDRAYTNKELADELKIHTSATSKHIRTLLLAKLIEGKRTGQEVLFQSTGKY